MADIHPDAKAVLDFWFVEHGKEHWWAGGGAFDVAVRLRFANRLVAAEQSELWAWRTTAAGRLAEIIVLDQFTRQLFRGSGRAFASDPLALALAQELVASSGMDELEKDERAFALMPFMHSESLAVHEHGLTLFRRYTDDNTVRFEERHLDVIRRFGRYPKRNAALGRVSTQAELEYIASSGDSMF